MTEAGTVVRIDVEEALATPDLRILAQRKVFWYVKVPVGSVAESYTWQLDVQKLLRGEKLPNLTDRLHLALFALYTAEARAQEAAAPGDLNRTQPLSVSYRLLTDEELAKRPWLGTQCLKLTEAGRLERASDREL
jgi:hypothetical protein